MYTINLLTDFYDYIRHNLGEPAIKVELCRDHMDMAISDSFKTFNDISGEFCFDDFYKLQITATHLSSKEFDVTSLNLLNIYDVYAFDSTTNSVFQTTSNTAPNLSVNSSQQISNGYYQGNAYSNEEPHGTDFEGTLGAVWDKVNQDEIKSVFTNNRNESKARFRYNKFTKILTITNNFDQLVEDNYILIYGTSSTDPEIYTDIFNNTLFRDLVVARSKKIWAMMLARKYTDSRILGDVGLNGDMLYSEAVSEIESIEAKIHDRYYFIPYSL